MVKRSREETLRWNAAYRERHRGRERKRAQLHNRRLKSEVLARYGTICAHCGFSDVRALQIDHIRGDGGAERRRLGGQNFAGKEFYAWLKAQGFPDGYQTLCANCNLIKHFGGTFYENVQIPMLLREEIAQYG